MKVTLNWLKRYVAFDWSPEELTERLTMLGREVEGVQKLGGECTGSVVAQVLSRDKHPNADKLSVCRVAAGTGERQIVCGAQNFQAVFEGGIRKSLEDSFMDLHVRQCNFYDEPERLFYMESKMYGVPYSGLHMYRGNNATMQVKIASIFPMINASGDIMLQSETVTMFADMCFMAPAALINKNIQWELIDSLTVKGKFTNAGKTIGATLYFNPKGELINFISMDRYMSADGKSFANYPWSTPTSDYKYFHGIRLGSYGEAIWQLPKGKLCYGKFRTVDIEYNVKQVK